MKTFSLITLFILSCVSNYSQDTIQLYLDANFQQVESKKKAVLLRKAIIRDDHYILKDQSINGEMLNYGEFISVNPFIEDGLSQHYEFGRLYSTGNYKNGKFSGKWIYVIGNYLDTVDYSVVENYYNEFRDSCKNNQAMKEESLIPTNDSLIIMEDLQKFVKHNLHFPSRAKDLKESINCNVNLHIDTTGHIYCPEILNCMSVDFTYELLRVLFLYKCDHKIGIPLKLTLPIYYDIEPSFVFVEKQAMFQSKTLDDFRIWVQNNLVYPSDAIKEGVSGRVTIQFAVTSKGEVVDIKILRGINSSLDKEAYHVVLSSPKWEAAQQGGRAVRQQFVMPVVFTLPEQ